MSSRPNHRLPGVVAPRRGHHGPVSQYPDPAPYGASGSYGGGPVPRRRERPGVRWFVLGALLLVAGLVLSVSAIVLSVAAFARVEARVPADGVSRTIPVEQGAEYLLWKRPGESEACTVVDATSRTDVPVRGLGFTSYTRDLGSGSWEGSRTFTARSSTIEITCAPGTSAVEVGEKPRVHTLVGGILLGLVLPILLPVVGFVLLLVVGILYAVRSPRRATPR